MLSSLWRNSCALLKSKIPCKILTAKCGMNVEEFETRAREVIDFICEYQQTIACKRVIPEDNEFGCMMKALPSRAPKCREDFDNIINDMHEIIMPAMVHWNHPRFFGYYPNANSYASLLAEMFCDHSAAISYGGWKMSPAAIELEEIVLDWYAKALGLPDFFLHECGSGGGGVINGSASECILVAMLTARYHAIKRIKNGREHVPDSTFVPKLVTYYSQETHSSVEKAANICLVKKHCLDIDHRYRLDGCTLEEAIEEDIKCGLTPFFVVATLGTTNMSAFDKLLEIVDVCRCYDNIWIHVDAAYAGNCFMCQEFRHLMEGIQCVNSFNCNPNEWILVVPDCSVIYYKDLCKVSEAMQIQHHVENMGGDKLDSCSLSMSRRFRAMKLWYILCSYGIEGLQMHIRRSCCLAKCFTALVKQDNRFEVLNDVLTGVVCFRLNGSNEINQQLLESINCEGQIHLTSTVVKRKYGIRLSINYEKASEEDICSVKSKPPSNTMFLKQWHDFAMPNPYNILKQKTLKDFFKK